MPSAALAQGVLASLLASSMVMDGSGDPVSKSVANPGSLGSADLLGLNELNNKKHNIDKPNSHIHSAMGHAWHDPNCECCKRARMTCKRHRREDNEYKYTNVDKGCLLGIDYIGKHAPDVDGNVHAMTAFRLKVYEAKVYEAKVYETEGIQGLKVYKTKGIQRLKVYKD